MKATQTQVTVEYYVPKADQDPDDPEERELKHFTVSTNSDGIAKIIMTMDDVSGQGA